MPEHLSEKIEMKCFKTMSVLVLGTLGQDEEHKELVEATVLVTMAADEPNVNELDDQSDDESDDESEPEAEAEAPLVLPAPPAPAPFLLNHPFLLNYLFMHPAAEMKELTGDGTRSRS